MAPLDVAIKSFGAYVPSLRVDRRAIASNHAWVAPSLLAGAKGSRSTCGWDEDSITLAVAAARDALHGLPRESIGAVVFGTTTAPFADRLNAGVVAAALGLDEGITALDVTGSLRAGTSAFLTAADRVAARGDAVLCVSADRRQTQMASTAELTTGHASAALIVGPGDGAARYVGGASLTIDFIDHFRSTGREFDYQWEERWIREEGYGKLVPRLIGDALSRAGISAADVTHFILPAPGSVASSVARKAGIKDEAVSDQLRDGCGESGAPHPVLMLVHTLEVARPGDIVLVASFGQGGDALVFEVSEGIEEVRRSAGGVRKWLARGATCGYPRFQVINGLNDIDRGIRGELDKRTALTAAYRHRDLALAFTGGRCELCGTLQIPSNRACANPDCAAIDSQRPVSFAERDGSIASLTSDRLVYTPDPPAWYGMVDFDGGGRLLMEFADIDGSVEVGDRMKMTFRIKDLDQRRGFTRYFWKAAPAPQEG